MSTEINGYPSFFSGRLKQFRDDIGWSAQKLADYIGVPRSTYVDAENGAKTNLDVIAGLAAKFPNDIHYLLTGEKPDSIHFTKGREEEERELMNIFRALPHKKQLNLLGMIRPDAIEIDDGAKPDDATRKKRPQKKTES